MSKTSRVPVTEQSHPLTQNIDISSPTEIVTQIYQCEQQLFKGWKGSKGLHDESILEVLNDLISFTADLIENAHNSLIVLSGCGTSGRIGFFTVRSFNKVLQSMDGSFPQVFQYLISGGDIALLSSQEQAEDDPHIGIKDLKEVTSGRKHVLLIGITCGLSAPYVAGQIDYALDHLDTFVPVIIGFNPADLARDTLVDRWDKTFYQVVKRLEVAHREKKGFLLNPIIGPEPITGSTRMKGGSATKLLLDTIFMAGILKTKGHILNIPTVLKAYELLQNKTYSYRREISSIMKMAGECLNKNGHIYYVGDETLGVFSLLDASECPPTFGADLDDIRGFLYGGFSSLGNKEGDLSTKFPISMDYFLDKRLPNLTDNDMIIFLCLDGKPEPRPPLLTSKVHLCTLNLTSNLKLAKVDQVKGEMVINIELPQSAIQDLLGVVVRDTMWRHMAELSCKWLLNAISSGAHIHKGKIYQNYMIDLKVSNLKLYHRAVAIIMEFTRTLRADAEKALLRSIYELDRLTSSVYNAQLGDHIQVATTKNRVVPVAIILAITDKSVHEAHDLIKEAAIVRIAISKCFHGNEALY